MNRRYRMHRLAALIATAPLTLGLSGCAGLALANRGAPDAEMKTFEVELSPVNLDAHTADAAGHDHAAATEPDATITAHDHNAADHDIDEHMAFLEQQAAQETDAAMAAPAEHGVVLTPYWTVLPESGWLHGYEFELVDSRGRALPSDILHHLQVLSPNRRELFSPVMLRIAGAGGETKPTGLPAEVGYPLAAGDSVVFTAMLHNPTGESLGDVRLKVRLHYSPTGGSWRAPADVVPFFTHVTPPLDDSAYDLPPGRSERSLVVRPSVSGQVLAMGGHLHRFGESLRIEDAETGELLWEQTPVRADDGTVLEVPDDVLVWNGAFDLVAGHAYRVTAVYDNPTGQMIPAGGMGTVGGVIRPRSEWPAVDTSDTEYLWDVEKMLGSGSVAGEQAHASH